MVSFYRLLGLFLGIFIAQFSLVKAEDINPDKINPPKIRLFKPTNPPRPVLAGRVIKPMLAKAILSSGPIKYNIIKGPVGVDPIRFTMTASKPVVAVGEEFELTITAELLDISPQSMFFFEEQKAYSLKILTPEGFVQTGGTYYDYIGGTFSKAGYRSATYTLTGHITKTSPTTVFSLLRGPGNASAVDLFTRVSLLNLKIQTIDQRGSARVATINSVYCALDTVTLKLFLIQPQKNKRTIIVSSFSPKTIVEYSLDNINYSSKNVLNPGSDSGSVFIRMKRRPSCSRILPYKFQKFQSTPITNTLPVDCQGFVNQSANITLSGSNTLCNNATVTLNLTFSIQPGTIKWFREGVRLPQYDNYMSITANTAGYYSVYCYSNDCTNEYELIIGASIYSCPSPPPPNCSSITKPTITPGSTTICGGNTTTLTASGCSNTVYWYDEEDNTPIFTGSILTNVYPGITYTAKCVEGLSCDGSSYTVGTLSPLTVSASNNSSTVCEGGQAALSASVQSGISATYVWKDNNGNVVSTPGSVGNGTYTVTASASGYCSASASTIVNMGLAKPTTPTLSATSPQCGQTKGSITVTNWVSGYTYSLNGGNFGSEHSWSDKDPGGYTVVANDGHCSSSAATAPISSAPASPDKPNVNDISYCQDAPASALTATGQNLKWYNSGGVSISGTPTPITSTPGTVTYKVTQTVDNCESDKAALTVTINPNISISASNNGQTKCPGENVYVTIQPTTTPGEIYRWTDSNGSQISTDPSFNTKNVGTYTLTVTRTGYCGSPATATTNVQYKTAPDAPSITASPNPVAVNENLTLTATGCDNGITWHTGSTANAITVNPSVVGSYTYSATCTKDGCISAPASGNVTVSETCTGSITVSTDKTSICAGELVTLTATACSGTMSWQPAGGTAQGSTYSVRPTATTTYTASCTKANCTTRTATQSITVTPIPAPPTISGNRVNGSSIGPTVAIYAPSSSIIVCDGNSLKLTATGCGNTTRWSNNMTGSSITIISPFAESYYATCESGVCTGSRSATAVLYVVTKPIITATKNTICVGETVTLTAGNANGGLTWSTGASGSSIVVSPTVSTNYSVTSRDDINVCAVASDVFSLGVVNLQLTASQTTICSGQLLSLTATGCPSTVTWSPGNFVGSVYTLAPSLASTNTITYTALCSAGSCSKTIPITVRGNETTVTATNSVTCNTASGTILASSSQGGTYLWNGPNGFSSTQASTNVNQPGSYTVSVSYNGCVYYQSTNVLLSSPAAPVITASPAQVCPGQVVTLTASCETETTVRWASGETTATLITQPLLTPASYTATCQRSAYCVSVPATKFIALSDFTIAASQTTVCTGSSVTLTASCCQATVVWSTGATGPSLVLPIMANTTVYANCKNGGDAGRLSNEVQITTLGSFTAGQPIVTCLSSSTTVLGSVTLSTTLSQPNSLVIQYQLERELATANSFSLVSAWSSSTASLTGLSGGRYRLSVRGANQDVLNPIATCGLTLRSLTVVGLQATASSTTITPGESVTLNADGASIDEQNGKALWVNGNATFTPSSDLVGVTSNFTWEGWVKPDGNLSGDINNERYVLYPRYDGAHYNDTYAGLGIAAGKNGIRLVGHTGYYLQELFSYTTTITDWTHVAVSFQNNVGTLLINGQVKVTNVVVPQGKIMYPSHNLTGFPYEIQLGRYVGAVDEVRTWNVGRSAADIARDYQRVLTGQETGLLSYWRFESAPGDVTVSSGPAGLSATLAGTGNFSLVAGAPRDPSSLTTVYTWTAQPGGQTQTGPSIVVTPSQSTTYTVAKTGLTCTAQVVVTVATQVCAFSVSALATTEGTSCGGMVNLAALLTGPTAFSTNFEDANNTFTTTYSDQSRLFTNPAVNDPNYCAMTDHTGNNGQMLRFSGEAPGTIWSHAVPVISGKTYQFSMWVRPIYNGTPAVLQRPVELRADNALVASLVIGMANPGCTTGWRLLTGSWTATSTGSVDFALKMPVATSFLNAFVVDDIEVRQVAGPATYSWQGPNGFFQTGQTITASPTASGQVTYTVLARLNTCSAQASANVSLTENVVSVTATTAKPIYTEGESLTLTATLPASLTSSVQYVWTGPNNYSATTQKLTIPTATSAMSGTYTVRITTGSGCTATGSVSLTVMTNSFTCTCQDCDQPTVRDTDNPVIVGNSAGNTDQNYVQETVYLDNGGATGVRTLSYLDGLGRPVQKVSVGTAGGSTGGDVVMSMAYDGFGRQPRQFLPYVVGSSNGAFVNGDLSGAITGYHQGLNPAEKVGDAFTNVTYESSPLGRVLKQIAPGGITPMQMAYRSNAAGEVKLLTYTAGSGTPVNVSTYGAGQLYVTESTDENSHKTSEYKDKEGRVVCKTVSGRQTLYGYDDMGRLRVVVPPLASGTISGNFDPFTLNDLLFAYDYDERGRMVRKKVPGAGITTMAYDNRDRLVMNTDANGIAIKTVYDDLDRVIRTQQDSRILSYTYYDSYVNNALAFDANHAYGKSARTDVRGQVTGTVSLRLGTDQNFINNTIYYDELGRVIQTVANNHKGGVDRSSSQLDFVGRTLQSRLTTSNSGTTITVDGRTAYDAGSRVKSICQKVSDDQQTPISNPTLAYWEPVARHQYNGIGELVRKTLGCGIQNIDYSYQMRGWLTKINNPADLNIGFLPADKHFYGQKLTYDEVGNITQWDYRNAQISYGPPYDLAQRPAFNYSFSYDNLNRLTGGNLTQQGQTIFNLDNLTYDDNGNIKTLNRTMGSATDRLGYNYASNSNRLLSLSDGGTADFAKSSSYDYDANGNLTKDVGKNITAIGYNHLNLPTQITRSSGGNYNYTYTASGQKLSASFPASGTLTARQYDYVGGLVYENNKLEFIPTAEGRVLPPGRASTTVTVGGSTSGIVGVNNYYRYEYHLTDHLGNLRVACRCGEKAVAASPSESYAPLVVQEVQYDPFGLQLTGLSSVSTVGVANRFTYNGKEEQGDLGWLNYGVRIYDPTVPRWLQIDPFSEFAFDKSGYVYAANNPVNRVDLYGLAEEEPKQEPIMIPSSNLAEVTVKAKRLTSGQKNPLNFSVDENWQLAYYRNMATYGEASPYRKYFRSGSNAAAVIVGAPLAAIGVAEIAGTGLLSSYVWSGFNSKLWASKLALSLTTQYVGAIGNGQNFSLNDIDFVDIAADQVLNPFAGAFTSATFDVKLNGSTVNSSQAIVVGTATGYFSNKTEGILDKMVESVNLGGVTTNVANYMIQVYQKAVTSVLTPKITKEVTPKPTDN